jgi:mono/diheme cytochrome c family protein
VLSVFLFAAFWVVVALSLFFVAVRGGLGGARETLQTQSRGGRKVVRTIFLIVFIGFGVAIPIAILTGNHANASRQVGGYKLTTAEKQGRILFGQNCAVCHTLAAANANGKVGPNLDQLMPPESLVLRTIANGCLQNAGGNNSESCLGYGTMPSQILEGKQAQDVAAFVARVAGRE